MREATHTTSSALVLGNEGAESTDATLTMDSTIRQDSLKLAAEACRNTAFEISRARVSREAMYSPT